MINTNLLNEYIKRSGLDNKALAKMCGMSEQRFTNCCNNRDEFRVSHIMTLCDVLTIRNTEEKESVFFAQEETVNNLLMLQTETQLQASKCTDTEILALCLELLRRANAEVETIVCVGNSIFED